MSEKEEGNKAWLAFIAGAVAGGIISYLITSGKGKELLNSLKTKLNELKDELGEDFEAFNKLFQDEKSDSQPNQNDGKQ